MVAADRPEDTLRSYASLYLDEEVRLEGWTRNVGVRAARVRQKRCHESLAVTAFAAHLPPGFFDDFCRQWRNRFLRNCDEQSASSFKFDFDWRRFYFDSTFSQSDIKGHTGTGTSLLPVFWDYQSPSSINGSLHTIQDTINIWRYRAASDDLIKVT